LKTSHPIFELVAVGVVIALGGCASVMSGRHADVSVKTNVPQAHVTVRDKHGQEVASAHAPASFTLKRKDKFIFPARYIAHIEAPGYQPVDVPIRQTVNPWVLGNVAFGGLIGLTVDNVTGAAWKPRQPKIYQELQPLHPGYPSMETAQRPSDPLVEPAGGVY
jgi:hypothetical protein